MLNDARSCLCASAKSLIYAKSGFQVVGENAFGCFKDVMCIKMCIECLFVSFYCHCDTGIDDNIVINENNQK